MPATRFTEKIANMPIHIVLIIIAVLILLRFILRKNEHPFAKSIGETSWSLAMAMALFFLIIKPFVAQAFYIPSGSMRPTLLEKDQIMVNKFIYRVSDPKFGDVAVFLAPADALDGIHEVDFIKRVIGVPGDTIKLVPGYVQVGNIQLSHSELRAKLARFSPDKYEVRIRLAKDHVDVSGMKISKGELAAALHTTEDKIKIVPGVLYRNGVPVDEPYIAEDSESPFPTTSTPSEWLVFDEKNGLQIKIPEGKYLMIGDNRNFSHDSRYWGLLDRNRIKGKAMFVWWPIERIHAIK